MKVDKKATYVARAEHAAGVARLTIACWGKGARVDRMVVEAQAARAGKRALGDGKVRAHRRAANKAARRARRRNRRG